MNEDRLQPRALCPENISVRILLVEDDARMRALVRRGLSEHGHVVDVAATGPDAVDVASTSRIDVIVLDLMLPGFDGNEVIRRIRKREIRTPVLMLTARDAAADVVSSLDAGADDYLAKPFSFAVLLARIRALGRRGPAVHEVRLQIADLSIDLAARVVTRGGDPIPLTRTEYNLLECLMRQAGRVVTRQSLTDALWGADRHVESNTLDAFVKSLRQKLDAGGRTRLIHTIRGVGFSVREEPEP
jgi:DNA-binding response OmpR family regulator